MWQPIAAIFFMCLVGAVPVALVLLPQLIHKYKRYRMLRKMAKLTRLYEDMGDYFGKNKPN